MKHKIDAVVFTPATPKGSSMAVFFRYGRIHKVFKNIRPASAARLVYAVNRDMNVYARCSGWSATRAPSLPRKQL